MEYKKIEVKDVIEFMTNDEKVFVLDKQEDEVYVVSKFTARELVHLLSSAFEETERYYFYSK